MTQNLKVAVKKKDSNETDTVISPVANPWMTRDMVNMLNGLKPDAVKSYRLVAVPQCSYSTVIQLRDWLPNAVGGVVWMAYDNPGQSPRIPSSVGRKISRLASRFADSTVTGKMPPYGLSVVPINSLPYVGERLKIV